MAKYELMEKTEINGEIWYYIRKDGDYSVNNTWTTKLEEAQEMLEQFEKGKQSEPIYKVLKTIEIDENETD